MAKDVSNSTNEVFALSDKLGDAESAVEGWGDADTRRDSRLVDHGMMRPAEKETYCTRASVRYVR